MRIYCVCVVRDEVDILPFSLEAAIKWADNIYVCDNSSTDGTWELLNDYARKHPQITLVDREHGVFRGALRGDIVNTIRHKARTGDWWCRLDADEIYFDDPREFLAGIKKWHDVVYSISHQYYFTDTDLASYEQNPHAFTKHWHPSLLRHYLPNWSEPRFVRHVPGVVWTDAWPEGFWKLWPAPRRIRLRHYQFRSPPQIARRLQTRIFNTEGGAFYHEKAERWLPKLGLNPDDLVFPDLHVGDDDFWRTRIIRASALIRDDDEHAVPPELQLPYWHPSPHRCAAYRLAREGSRLRKRLQKRLRSKRSPGRDLPD